MADVIVVSQPFLCSDIYRQWLFSFTEGSFASQNASKTFIRKAFYARQSISACPALLHFVHWNRIIMDNFHMYLEEEQIKSLESSHIFGISDACASITRQGLSNYICPMPRSFRNLLVCQLCTFTRWKSDRNHNVHDITPCRADRRTIFEENITSVTWIELNLKKYLWFKHVPTWQKKRVHTLISTLCESCIR